jgi:hypothetical protein
MMHERQIVDREERFRGPYRGRQREVGRVEDIERSGDNLDRDWQAKAMPQSCQPIVAEWERAEPDALALKLQPPVIACEPSDGSEDGVLMSIL